MRLVYGENERCLSWASERIGGLQFRPDARTIGHERNGKLAAVCVFDGFSAADANIHVASDGSRRWLTRGFLAAVFAFPFIQVGLRRVTGLVPARNLVARQFNRRLGFDFEGLCRHALPDDDIVVLGMLRSRCKFIPPEYRHD